jgi:hypothetical protein
VPIVKLNYIKQEDKREIFLSFFQKNGKPMSLNDYVCKKQITQLNKIFNKYLYNRLFSSCCLVLPFVIVKSTRYFLNQRKRYLIKYLKKIVGLIDNQIPNWNRAKTIWTLIVNKISIIIAYLLIAAIVVITFSASISSNIKQFNLNVKNVIVR